MDENALQIAKLRAALAEILSQRDVFSQETYTQIVMALYDRIRLLQTQPVDLSEGDEIRLATVMFIDVKDSTQIARRVQAENWKKIIGDAHVLLGKIVRRWDGEVGQYLGDGMLCFFGTQRSLEDDALRAVQAALEAQEAIGAFAAQIRTQYRAYQISGDNTPPLDFTVRIGISTGQVVVGMVGDAAKMELLAMGTPTNLAARLQTLAEPGTVLIDANTYHRVRDHFAIEANGQATLKGFEKPVEYFRVSGRQQRRDSQLAARSIATIPTPFVGREDELNRLLDMCRAVERGEGFTFALVTGEVGIGKSRLLQETLDRASTLSMTRLVVSASYDRRMTAYSLLRALVALLCDLKDDSPPEVAEPRIEACMREHLLPDDVEVVAHIVGFLAGYGFENSPHVQTIKLGGGEQKRGAYSRIALWFHALTERLPLLLVVDNLQWADFESLELLEFMATDLALKRMLLLVAARPEFKTQYADYMAGISRQWTLTLERLDERYIMLLLRAVLQNVDHLPDNLPALIRDRAEGNPLFVEEFLRMLFDSGVFEVVGAGRWKTNRVMYETLEAQLPGGLQALLQARLDELRASTRRIVQIASVIGQTFWESALVELGRLQDVQPEIADLERRGIIVRQDKSVFEGEREYAFRHSLYREVAYAMLTSDSRRYYHRGAADWLVRRVLLRPDYLEVLAGHYLQAGQHEQALAVYWSSAVNLYERGILPRVLRLIERGWDIARDVPREVALPIVSRLWLLRGQVLDSLDEYAEASAASETALMLLNEMPPGNMLEERISASLTLGNSYIHLGRYDEALEVLRAAHSMLPKEHVRYHAAVLRTFGVLFRARGQLNESLAYQQEALGLAEASGDAREVARVLTILGGIALDRGDFATALAYHERVLKINEQDGNVYYQILDLRHLASVYRALLAFDRALEACAQAERLQNMIRYRDPVVLTNRGLCLLRKGEIGAGMALLREANQHTHQNVYVSDQVQLALVEGLLLAGDPRACQKQAAALAAELRERNYVLHGRALLWLGAAQAQLGSQSQARKTLQLALEAELEYGGRDAWLCYQMLSTVQSDKELAADAQQKAWYILEALVNSLHTRPDLQSVILANAEVRALADASYVSSSE